MVDDVAPFLPRVIVPGVLAAVFIVATIGPPATTCPVVAVPGVLVAEYVTSTNVRDDLLGLREWFQT